MSHPAAENTHPQVTLLQDYKPHDYHLYEIHLTFDLAPENTIVTAISHFRKNTHTANSDLVLDGERMTLKSLKLNNKALLELIKMLYPTLILRLKYRQKLTPKPILN